MPHQVTIRRGIPDDLQQILTQWAAYLSESEKEGGFELANEANLKWYQERFLHYLCGIYRGIVLVAADEGRIVGVFLAGEAILRTQSNLGRVAENLGIFVSPDYRTQGVAHQLRARGLDEARNMGFDTYMSSYKPENPMLDSAGARILQTTTVVDLRS